MTRQEEINNASNQLLESFKYSKTFKIGFEAGVEWADENSKSPWISVKDDLPCNNPNNIHFSFTNRVLATNGKNILILYMKRCRDNKWIWCDDEGIDLSYFVTHWTPFPKLPK